MVGHGGSSAGSYLADPTSPIPSHCTSIVATSTLRVNADLQILHIRSHFSGIQKEDSVRGLNKLFPGMTEETCNIKCHRKCHCSVLVSFLCGFYAIGVEDQSVMSAIIYEGEL